MKIRGGGRGDCNLRVAMWETALDSTAVSRIGWPEAASVAVTRVQGVGRCVSVVVSRWSRADRVVSRSVKGSADTGSLAWAIAGL
jgi:hypothetical protein